MKKFLILAVVVLMMVPALAKNMAEGRFGVGLALGTGESMLRNGNTLALGIKLQYGITGLTFEGVFNYGLPIQPEAYENVRDLSESVMDFGVNFLGTVGDGPFVGYAGLGFFYIMRSWDIVTGLGEVETRDTSTYGLNLAAAMDYFLTDMISIGFQLGYPISLGSDDGLTGDDDFAGDDYEGGYGVNAEGISYKVTFKVFF